MQQESLISSLRLDVVTTHSTGLLAPCFENTFRGAGGARRNML